MLRPFNSAARALPSQGLVGDQPIDVIARPCCNRVFRPQFPLPSGPALPVGLTIEPTAPYDVTVRTAFQGGSGLRRAGRRMARRG